MPAERYILTGPPGAGKTTVLEALQVLSPSLHIVPEAARRVIAGQRARGEREVGDADPARFLALMRAQCLEDWQISEPGGLYLYDRALPDLMSYGAFYGEPVEDFGALAARHRYESTVFWCPSWPEIYVTDEDRRATPYQLEVFASCLKHAYIELGYELVSVPKLSVAERADFILGRVKA